ncbi:MAG: hypothetical protein KA752_10515 [Giesbergeria sp.]|nr:hypothetical protein [Giesbergeria sp.]
MEKAAHCATALALPPSQSPGRQIFEAGCAVQASATHRAKALQQFQQQAQQPALNLAVSCYQKRSCWRRPCLRWGHFLPKNKG